MFLNTEPECWIYCGLKCLLAFALIINLLQMWTGKRVFLQVSCMYPYLRLSQDKVEGKIIPSVPWVPLFGSLPFLTRYPERKIAEWGRNNRYGSIFQVRFGTMKTIILNDLDAIRECLVRNGHRVSGRSVTPLIKEMTDGNGILFLDYNEKWKVQRKFGHAALRRIANFERLTSIIQNESTLLVRALEMQISATVEPNGFLCDNYKPIKSTRGNWKRSKENVKGSDLNNNEEKDWCQFNASNFTHTATANIMCNLLFGRSFTPNENQYLSVLEETPKQARKSFTVFMLAFLVPLLRHMPILRSVINEALCLRKLTFEMIRDMVEEHINKSEVTGENDFDFVDCYLEKIKFENGDVNSKKTSFNQDQLCNYIFDLFTAGTETTADTINWTLLYLAKHTEVQKKIRDEIHNVTKDQSNNSSFSCEFSKLHVLRASIHESLRIRPLAPLGMVHKASRETVVQGFKIPKNSTVIASLWSVQHDTRHFADPEKFCPYRHINEQGEFVPSKYVIAFSIGPRQCMGKKIAEMSMLVILTNILRRFEIRLPQVWDESKKKFISSSPEFKGESGHILLPPDCELEWKRRN